MHSRASPIGTYNLDLTLVGDYWGWYDKRFYHHTGLVSNMYALREALDMACEEGLGKMGLTPFVKEPAARLETVNTINVPEGVDAQKLIDNAMQKYSLEISGGLGPSAGKVFRVGIMGYNATPRNIELVLQAFRDGLQQQGAL